MIFSHAAGWVEEAGLTPPCRSILAECFRFIKDMPKVSRHFAGRMLTRDSQRLGGRPESLWSVD
jgi:hypothetical protein